MRFLQRDGVRAFLPAVALAFCHGCGGGGGGGSAPPQGAAPSPVTANRAPSISGAAANHALVGVPYEFQPAATDPDGDPLTFTATNLPPWVQINPSSGKLSGTPGEDDVGEYEAITVVVADASHHAETTPFSITVSGGTGVAKLQWEKPGSKMDGSPLDDLAGYHIVYGRSAENLDHSVFVGDPEQTSFEFSTLSSGIWYFAVIGVSASGLEGPPTPTTMKSI